MQWSFKTKSLPVKCVAGSFITGVELATGLVVNVMMKRKVWDYSDLPFNIKGQVCLPFTVIWG
ncbi:MAG: putative ABC transporter permease [Acutalibacteraceae bacterium]